MILCLCVRIVPIIVIDAIILYCYHMQFELNRDYRDTDLNSHGVNRQLGPITNILNGSLPTTLGINHANVISLLESQVRQYNCLIALFVYKIK